MIRKKCSLLLKSKLHHQLLNACSFRLIQHHVKHYRASVCVSSAYKEKVRELPLVSLLCACLNPQTAEKPTYKAEGKNKAPAYMLRATQGQTNSLKANCCLYFFGKCQNLGYS